MRHLQDIDAAQLRMGRQQRLLGGWFEVTEQQKGQPARTDEQGDAGVVGAVDGVEAGRLTVGSVGPAGPGMSGGAGGQRTSQVSGPS